MADSQGPGFDDALTRDEDWGAQLFQAGLEFADNPEPRCPCILLLDTSKSMAGDRVAALNQGLQAFRDELIKDPLARQRVEVAIVNEDLPHQFERPSSPPSPCQREAKSAPRRTCCNGLNTVWFKLRV